MRECSPGELDPHAVASVFKAFLRERKSSLRNFATKLIDFRQYPSLS